MLANKPGADCGCPIKIILYVMLWDEIVMHLYKKYSKEINIADFIEAHIQMIMFKKTLKGIIYEHSVEQGLIERH